MRTILFIMITIIILGNSSCDNYEISDKQADSFLKFYGVGMEDKGIRVITTEDGYLIMGICENPGRERDIFIIQTDKYGNSTEPVKTYGGLYEDNGYAIKPTDDGYIIAGSTREFESADKDVFLMKINAEGDTLWTRTYSGEGNYDDEAYDILLLDTTIILTGYTSKSETDKDFLFFKLNAEGDSLIFNPMGNAEEQVANAIVQSGTMYMLAGYTSTSGQQYSKRSCTIRWAGTGSPSIVNYSLGISSEAMAIYSSNDNEYYIACNVQLDQSATYQITLLKIDMNQEAVWQKSFGERNINMVRGLAIHNNSLYAVGTSTNETNEENSGDILILKTNLTGENPVYYYTGDGESYLGNGFDFTSDGGYIITGANFVSNKSVIILCKLNAEGTLQ